MVRSFPRDRQYYKFCMYGFLKNLKFFDPFIVLFFRESGLSFLEIGTLFSVREIATNVLEVPTGVAADTCGRRLSMVYSFGCYILSFIIFYFFPEFWIYAAAMVLFGAGEAFRSGTHKAMILHYLEMNALTEYRVNYYGHTRGWAQTGSAVSSLAAAGLVFYSGSYRIIFLASTLPYVAALVLMLTYPGELDGEMKQGGIDSAVSRTKNRLKGTLKNFIAIFKQKGTVRALLNSSFYDAVFRSVKDYLQPVLRQYALLIPVFMYLSKDRRVALATGAVYFILYILTALSSANSYRFIRRATSLPAAINIAFLGGGALII
ncbi:MAG: MFS transporter, partial [Spirochaetota bacterium]